MHKGDMSPPPWAQGDLKETRAQLAPAPRSACPYCKSERLAEAVDLWQRLTDAQKAEANAADTSFKRCTDCGKTWAVCKPPPGWQPAQPLKVPGTPGRKARRANRAKMGGVRVERRALVQLAAMEKAQAAVAQQGAQAALAVSLLASITPRDEEARKARNRAKAARRAGRG